MWNRLLSSSSSHGVLKRSALLAAATQSPSIPLRCTTTIATRTFASSAEAAAASPVSETGSQYISPFRFHYEDVVRQDLLLKQNHKNVMEVPGFREIRVVPSAASDLIAKNGKLALEIPCGQKLVQTGSTGRSFPGSNNKDKKGVVSDLARQVILRGHGMSNFLVRILTAMSLLDSPVEIRGNCIRFSMDTEFCECSPELEDHFEILEHIRGFNVTIVTSANTQDETSLLWSGFLQKDMTEI